MMVRTSANIINSKPNDDDGGDDDDESGLTNVPKIECCLIDESTHKLMDNVSNVDSIRLKAPISGVTKSISCTTEWCLATGGSGGIDDDDDNNLANKSRSNGSRMMLSNSSASLLKAKNYLHLYCHNLNHKNSAIGQSSSSFQQQISYDIEPMREHWDKKIEFLLAVIGFAVDLGNVWRFPYVCYRNGGGAFLVAYCTMLLFGGLPLFYLELALGQYFSSGCLTIWKRLCPIMKGLGYAICMIDIYLGMYYNTIISWSLYYLYESCQALVNYSLPWEDCNHPWNTDRCQTLEQRAATGMTNSIDGSSLLNQTMSTTSQFVSPAEEYYLNHVLQINQSPGIGSLGPIRWSLALCLMIVFIVVYFSLWKGVKSTGKAVWVTALMPYFVIIVLLIRATTLDGAADGIRFYLEPDWSKLLSINVWIDAATQIFFSLGPGFGTLMALSSYNKFHNNCYRDAIITSTVNCLTSFVAGFVTFSILGFMSKKLNKEISSVVADGPGLVFIVYPEAISTMYGSVYFSILFFVMLITLGLDSTFGGLEAMITALCDSYPRLLRRNREIFVAVLICFIYLCALPTTTNGGNYLINLLDQHGTAMPLLFIVFIETIAICWFYGSEKFSHQIKEMLGEKPGLFWRLCWRVFSPLFLGFISIASVTQLKPLTLGDYEYPHWSLVIGWIISLSSLSCIPIYGVYHYWNTPGDGFRDRLAKCFRPTIVSSMVSPGGIGIGSLPPETTDDGTKIAMTDHSMVNNEINAHGNEPIGDPV